MTQEQIQEAKKLIGKMPGEEIAKSVGVSLSSLKRAFRGQPIAFYNYCVRQPDLVRRVNKYYEKHGLKATSEAFSLRPKQVEHIIHRYKSHQPRQIRWTDNQIVEVARMAGLVSVKAQAKFFNRPGAYEGSIKSIWTKRFGVGAGSINGMVHSYARSLVTSSARYLKPLGTSRKGKTMIFRRLILWVDMEKCLKPEVPDFIRQAVTTMAEFQRWLWRSENPRPLILKMIRERETEKASK